MRNPGKGRLLTFEPSSGNWRKNLGTDIRNGSVKKYPIIGIPFGLRPHSIPIMGNDTVNGILPHLKQLFRVKTFVGTSPNAVRIQMWCSMITMLLIRYLKKRSKHTWHMSNLVVFLRINLFVKIDLWKWVNKPMLEKGNSPPQNTLFE